jgi:hypothetical protein
VISESAKEIGSIIECDLEQHSAFADLAEQDDAFKSIYLWDREVVAQLGYIIGRSLPQGSRLFYLL